MTLSRALRITSMSAEAPGGSVLAKSGSSKVVSTSNVRLCSVRSSMYGATRVIRPGNDRPG